MKKNIFEENDAPILIVMGQSNAHGHGTRLPKEEEINTPLTNVFGLDRQYNQAYDLDDVVWSGFTTGGMNLGETQDHTYCLMESFARLWQADTDAGIPLPPLYCIQISIGAQGIANEERDGLNMWYKNRPRVMKTGGLDGIDISLYPLACQILSLAMKNLRAAGKNPCVIGLHWNQWETEVHTGGSCVENAENNYREFFKGFEEAIGEKFPLWLYEPLARVYNNPPGVIAITSLFEKFTAESELVHYMKTSLYPGFDPSRDDQGIFLSDCVHYSPSVSRWFASEQYNALFGSK